MKHFLSSSLHLCLHRSENEALYFSSISFVKENTISGEGGEEEGKGIGACSQATCLTQDASFYRFETLKFHGYNDGEWLLQHLETVAASTFYLIKKIYKKGKWIIFEFNVYLYIVDFLW